MDGLRLGERLAIEGHHGRPGDARDAAGIDAAGNEILARALAAGAGRERRAVDSLEQPVAAQHVERVGREIDDIERRGAAADLGFDRGERAVIGLGGDLDASLLGEGLEIGDLLRLPIGAAPACDGEARAARRGRRRPAALRPWRKVRQASATRARMTGCV